MEFATKALHIGQAPDPVSGATILPITMSTTFTQEGVGVHKGFEYSRTGNPTRDALEACLAALEGGTYCSAFSSGSAATAAVLSILRPGDRVVAGDDIYGGTYRQLERIYRPLGITVDYVDQTSVSEFDAALAKGAALAWIETPTNPLLKLADIEALAKIAKKRGVPLIVDNTFASPYLQNPLSLGAAAVVHSTTKYINGHSDVVGGAVISLSEEIAGPVKFYQNASGGVPSPLDAWLTLRGLKTLELRMKKHCENAQALADFLETQPMVSKVFYPGLKSHPQHDLARRTLVRGFGGMVSFRLRGGTDEIETVNNFVSRLSIISFGESLGGVESLLCHPASMTHASIPLEKRLKYGIDDGLLRLSVGIEDVDDLIKDIEAAL
jgi:cystathionine beta-lyase/cystathionine gamma-synthase